MFKKNNHNFSFIKNNKELDQFITKIKNKKKFFFDTEFERRSTYKAIISIIVIFDALANSLRLIHPRSLMISVASSRISVILNWFASSS